jgi:hypothetical protein
MAKKPTSKKKQKQKVWTPEKIVNLWKTSSKKGLGKKVFEKEIFKEFEPKLLAAVKKHLSGPPPTPPHVFTPKDEANTKYLARTLGTICRLVTLEKEVTIDTFQKGFALIKGSPRCPRGGGGGEWCDI